MFDYIKRANIQDAIKQIDEQGVPVKRRSTKYCLVENERHYPPKYVIRVAHKIVKGEPPRKGYSGGKPTNNFLKSLDFNNIQECGCGGIQRPNIVQTSLYSEKIVQYSLNTILFGPPGTGKTYATRERCVNICFGKNEERKREEIKGKYRDLVQNGRVEFVTFHQSYGYEEFVEGLRPETKSNENAGSGFRLVPREGVLLRIANRAHQNAIPHVLVIDEINRANISKVLGELITILEDDKREGADNEIGVTLPYSEKKFMLPRNLYILGTMNTADRSITQIDTAIRRRFDFEELQPQPNLLADKKEKTGVDLEVVLHKINERIEYLLDRDHLIGHAWFMTAESRADVDKIMQNKIIPLLDQYFYEDWNKVKAVLGKGDSFLKREELKPPAGIAENFEKRYSWQVQEKFPDDAYDRLIVDSNSTVSNSQ